MADFRKFKITNKSQTESIDLNDFNGYLATSPEGLGIYRTSEYITIGTQRLEVNNKNTFRKIMLNVYIMGNRGDLEDKYASLRDFIGRNIKDGFRLYYTPKNVTRYIECSITIVDKTEKAQGYLPITLEIQPLSLWLEDVQLDSISQHTQEGNLFEFVEQNSVEDDYERPVYCAKFEEVESLEDDYERPVYSVAFTNVITQGAVLNNTGVEETPLLIKIFGRAVYPIITLKKYGSNTISQYVSFDNLVIEEGNYLEISSAPLDTHIELVNSNTGARVDKENEANIESNIYLTLPVGKWVIEIADTTVSNECYAQIYYTNQNYGG